MIATGQTIANPTGGGLGVILNIREIAQTADGRVLAEYEAIEVKTGGQSGSGTNPYGIGDEASSGLRNRIVDPRTLTEAQAVASGASRSEYRDALEASNESTENSPAGNKAPADLDATEKADVSQLQARDSAVKQEEKAHAAAAGPYGSAPQYEYQIGPDGKAYAIGGHVDVAASLSGSPEDKERALATLQNAALAPNAPSGADMSAFRQASLLRATGADEEPKPIPGYSQSRNDATGIISINA